METCISCAVRTDDFAVFKCPNCGTRIVRCYHCRSTGKKYSCPKCGFAGP